MDEFPDVILQSLPGGAPLKRVEGEHATDEAGRDVPVYAASDSAPRGVPTGRVLVRFSEEIKFDEKSADIAAAGFVVDQVLSYAPHAGWVRPASGRTEDALRHFERLAKLTGVRHVEPQLLYDRALR
jgi:hypothetical protein